MIAVGEPVKPGGGCYMMPAIIVNTAETVIVVTTA
jgi:hypothetical protein